MIPARGAVPQGPNPPKPPEFKPGTTPDRAHRMDVAAISIETTRGAGQQPPTATGQRYTPYSSNISLQPDQDPPMERVSCLAINLPEGPDDDFSDMSKYSATITYMDATTPSSNGSKKDVHVPHNKRCRGSKRSHMPPNSLPAENTLKPDLTIIFKPKNPEDVITRLNQLALKTAFEEGCSSDGVLQVRPNERLNLLAVDTRNADASERLLKISSIAEVLVQAYEPRRSNITVGVIKGVPVDLDQADILAALLQRAPVRLQARCSRCSGNHDRSSWENEEPQGPNCKKKHESTSAHCLILRKEKRIHNYKVENNVGQKMRYAMNRNLEVVAHQ
ncbi:hypothetical protein HPB51_029445 [Rhipicephalus microplus]|uniref:Uncharacterized protein n=1 Tax=Rhipicephalus microplus TaxID=6941 RepID=A0A9J6CUA2_RHIMP|nr:hypothetical protein HPB51_029445 [Rhipicephalus microplus]